MVEKYLQMTKGSPINGSSDNIHIIFFVFVYDLMLNVADVCGIPIEPETTPC